MLPVTPGRRSPGRKGRPLRPAIDLATFVVHHTILRRHPIDLDGLIDRCTGYMDGQVDRPSMGEVIADRVLGDRAGLVDRRAESERVMRTRLLGSGTGLLC